MMINLFSDTASEPTLAMREAMIRAPLGDEQRRTDPTVNKLQTRMAERLGKPAALLLPTATMANQIAMILHCPYAAEIICHDNSHLFNFEGGGAAVHARAQFRTIQKPSPFFTGSEVEERIRPLEPLCPSTKAVVIENTSNLGGGTIWPDADFDSVTRVCAAHGIAVHLDGARLFNAAVKRGVDVSHWSARVDTVQVCFSKGLGCPFGAVLAGSLEQIERAHHIKQSFGGALRQAGMIAGAMLYALDNHVNELAEDHRRLDELAKQLAPIADLELSPHETNILYFHHRHIPSTTLAERLRQNGLDLSVVGSRLRACTYLGVTDSQIHSAAQIVRETVMQNPT